MAERTARVSRETKETSIQVALDLDGSGQHDIITGIGMLDHLISQLARHGNFDIQVRATGDIHIDEHHTVEDVALCLGQALRQALGDGKGIVRMGHAIVPMDEALALVAVDISGRGNATVEARFRKQKIGELASELIPHMLESMAAEGRFNLHAQLLAGRDDHHRAEALFKALGRALEMATRLDPRRAGEIPSTKGHLI